MPDTIVPGGPVAAVPRQRGRGGAEFETAALSLPPSEDARPMPEDPLDSPIESLAPRCPSSRGGALTLDLATVYAGGAVELGDGASMVVEDTTFIRKECGFAGAAIAVDDAGTLTATNVVFEANVGSEGGAIAFGGAELTITSTVFTGNEADTRGGAILVDNDTASVDFYCDDCVFEDNVAGTEGGAVFLFDTVGLSSGRFTHFGKVHPFPMFKGVAEAARATGHKVHLVMAGWAEEDHITAQFEEGARIFAAGIRTTIVNGMDPKWRFRVWRCGDVFTSLTDNIQETLSQTILEAQACGLPVVVTDWDGCRDEVADGETGFLVPARMVEGATRGGTSRYLFGESSYAELLADTNQTVSVDVPAATAAFRRLFVDAELRARMGRVARQRILETFTWRQVVRRYDEVWREQDAVRQDYVRAERSSVRTPPLYPDVEFSFASYPSELLTPDRAVASGADAESDVELVLASALTSYRKNRRVADHQTLLRALRRAHGGCSIADVCAELGTDPERARATVAWMLKYDLLRVKAEPWHPRCRLGPPCPTSPRCASPRTPPTPASPGCS
jgi:predicted outer membrane repeat protein